MCIAYYRCIVPVDIFAVNRRWKIFITTVSSCGCNTISSSSSSSLWSSGQSFWLQIQRSRVRSPALPDFLSNSGSGTGSTQPREVN